MDMINLRHAKKAQALASDLDYRKRLHEYTVVPEDMKTKWAKKAYNLQSDVRWYILSLTLKGSRSVYRLFQFNINSPFICCVWFALWPLKMSLQCLWNWKGCTCSHANIAPVFPMLINIILRYSFDTEQIWRGWEELAVSQKEVLIYNKPKRQEIWSVR